MKNSFKLIVFTGCALTLSFIVGCASLYGPAADEANIAMVLNLDYGVKPNRELIMGEISDEFLKDIQPDLIDPYSARIEAIQTKELDKCIIDVPAGTDNWLGGYCISFTWNSKNRMGGYGGGQDGQGWVHVSPSGKITTAAFASYGSQTRAPITESTGVYVLTTLSTQPRRLD